jgi:2-isopropylmalate synthase
VGSDAQGEVTVNVDHEGQSYRGSGTSVDIVEAGSKAYLGVINRIIRRQKKGIESVPQNNNIHRAPI